MVKQKYFVLLTIMIPSLLTLMLPISEALLSCLLLPRNISVRIVGAEGAAAPQVLKNYASRANFQKLAAYTRAKMQPKQCRITFGNLVEQC